MGAFVLQWWNVHSYAIIREAGVELCCVYRWARYAMEGKDINIIDLDGKEHIIDLNNIGNKAIRIDCMELMKALPDKCFELAIVDPPYGLDKGSLNGAGKLKFRALNKMNTEWDKSPNGEYFEELERVSQNQIIWGGNYFGLPPTRGIIVWDKKQYLPTFSRCEYAWTSFYKPAKLFEYDNASYGKIHPTQKPTALYDYLLANYAHKGDRILDTHLGSQSSRIAAWQAEYNFLGCEIDKDYFEQGCKRYESYAAQCRLI